MTDELKQHWEKVYKTKSPSEVSWTEEYPETSLEMITSSGLAFSASIIDIGGGDSYLAEQLLDLGYLNLTVLDISSSAIERAKQRLGEKASKIKWIVSDITEFKPIEIYDLWHDRATFHFLTKESDIVTYLDLLRNYTKNYLVIGTFSDHGPEKCSGLPVTRYSANQLEELLQKEFIKVKCLTVDHKTPFDTVQNFLYCAFKKHQQ